MGPIDDKIRLAAGFSMDDPYLAKLYPDIEPEHGVGFVQRPPLKGEFGSLPGETETLTKLNRMLAQLTAKERIARMRRDEIEQEIVLLEDALRQAERVARDNDLEGDKDLMTNARMVLDEYRARAGVLRLDDMPQDGRNWSVVASLPATPTRWYVCDFCGVPETIAVFAAGEVRVKVGDDEHVMDEDWVSCTQCFNLITQLRWKELTERSMEVWSRKYTGKKRELGRSAVRHLHDKFRAAYQGTFVFL